MQKIDRHIEIVSSSITTLSSMSDVSRRAIAAILDQHFTRVDITLIDNLADLQALVARKPDLVFLGMKYLPTQAGLGARHPSKLWISDYLDQHGITYTGSNQNAHHLELNKQLAKQRVMSEGLKSSRYFVAKQHRQLVTSDITLDYPVFIKPSNRGGGVGIDDTSLAYNFEAVVAKVQSITSELQSDSLIEEYLPGREFSVAILRNELDDEYLVMPIELVSEGSSVLSQEVKSANTEIVLEVTDLLCKSLITSLALNVFHALGARDYGRIDIRMDAANSPHFLEANLIPSLITGYGSFPKASLINENLEHEPMILRIVNLALSRTTKSSVEPILATPINYLVPASYDAQPAF